MTTILVTDSHPDHTGSLPFLLQAFSSARLLAQPAVIADLQCDGPVYHGRLRARLGEEIAPTIAEPAPLGEDHLDLDGQRLPLIALAGGHSANLTTVLLPGGRLIASELVYQGHHLFLREKRIAGWRANLDQLAALAAEHGITRLIPSHGQPCGLDEIERMRSYFTVLEAAVAGGDRIAAAARVTAAFPDYRLTRFLTDYTLPAYLP